MLLIRDAELNDLPEMLAIYNEAVRNLTATFDLQELTMEERRAWFDQHKGKFPFIVAVIDGEVAGYSCLSQFNGKPAYSRTTELSIYISSKHRGHGIGSALMNEMIQKAEETGVHTMISLISGGNLASIKLHEKFGFKCAGCLKEVGFKFGKWQDVFYYQRMISQEKSFMTDND